jgi:DNA-binding response OmpR family regulator
MDAFAAFGTPVVAPGIGRSMLLNLCCARVPGAASGDGWEVARAAREVDPDFPVIYMSGNASNQWPIQGVPKSIMLNKPFAPVQLVRALSPLLNEHYSGASDVTG